MRFFAVLALTAVASAAHLNKRQNFPSCSTSCLTGADFGSCDPLDDSCLCNSQPFVSSVTNCIVGACQGDDLTNAEAAAQGLCAAVGVTLTAEPTTSAASTGSSGSATGAPAGSASTTATTPTSSATETQASGSNSAASHGVNALAALVAVGAAALVL
ncbi:hypothetical protein C8Q74DRAFT_1219245 [Fomes fomentarius]|nr:hypothetical protein C8Q74DRAFT_1219245 [Fomes fomentarius]